MFTLPETLTKVASSTGPESNHVFKAPETLTRALLTLPEDETRLLATIVNPLFKTPDTLSKLLFKLPDVA